MPGSRSRSGRLPGPPNVAAYPLLTLSRSQTCPRKSSSSPASPPGVGRETARFSRKAGRSSAPAAASPPRRTRRRTGRRFPPLCFDVAKRDVVVEMFANLPEGFKDIDVLLNNAGSSIGQNPAQAGNMDDWDEMIATNINGLLYCTRCVLPGMIERGSGHIVNIGSVAGNRAFKCGNVYGATKAFVNHFSRMLRCDLLGTPVRVTNIKPGHLHTEFLAVRFKGDLKTSEAAYENLDPLTPENIAESVWWSVNLPAHMDVCDMELMPMCQSDGGWSFCHKS
ncbi:MAG: SDR family NAD(P)-dependent oxidoreductase [Bilophila wadsworthia]